MKRLFYFLLLNLIFINYSSASIISYTCDWGSEISHNNKRIINVYEISNNQVLKDSKKLNITFINLTNKNIEYKYTKVNNLNTKFNYHFILNIHSGIAIETFSSQDESFNEGYVAVCEFI